MSSKHFLGLTEQRDILKTQAENCVSLLILLLARKHFREVTVPNITGVSKTQGKEDYVGAYRNYVYNAVSLSRVLQKNTTCELAS